jgi:hypothetical protein
MVGGILILMGLIVLAVPIFFEVDTEFSKVLLVSGIPIVIGVIMISTYSGTLIEFENHKFKEYQSILWIKFGDWQNLPKIENAELIHYTSTQTNTPNGISPTLSGEVTVYKCVLVSGGKKFMVFDYSKEKDAIVALDIIRNGFRL